VKNAFGIIEAAPLVSVDVETDQEVTGHSYIFAYKPLVHLVEEIGRDLIGRAVAPFDLMALMDAKFRLLGLAGPGRNGGVRPRYGFWDALGTGRGSAIGPVAGRVAAPDPDL
jgi:mandelate racemase